MIGFNRSPKKGANTLFILMLFFVNTSTFGQAWYNELKSEHKRSRFGIGVVAGEPLGLIMEVFKGEFCSNGNGYKAGTIWMLNLGVEHIVTFPSLIKDPLYDNIGPLKAGGMRAEIGVLYKVFSIATKPFTVQFHMGPAVEGGSRNYAPSPFSNETTSNVDVAGNAHARLTITPSGIEVGRGIGFISFHAALKYQYVFNAEYSYLKPTFGVIFRKVR